MEVQVLSWAHIKTVAYLHYMKVLSKDQLTKVTIGATCVAIEYEMDEADINAS